MHNQTMTSGEWGNHMTDFLPKDVREGLKAAHKAKLKRRRHRLTIHAGDEVFPILQIFDQGFSVETETAPNLRGLVDIFDGPKHLTQALIVASAEEGGVMNYEFKRNTQVSDRAALDFERMEPEVSGYLPVDL